MHRRSTLFAALAATVMLTGCGGSSSSDQTSKFKTDYEAVATQLQQSGRAIGTAIQQAPGKSDAQIYTTFHGLASRWQGQISRLQTLKPPSKVAADFNTITSAAARVESDLNAVVDAAATHSQAAGAQGGAAIVTDFLAVRSADAVLRRKLGIK